MSPVERRLRRLSVCGLVFISILVLGSSASLSSVAEVPEDLFSGVTTLLAPYSPHPTVDVDGVISSGEYNSDVIYKTADTGISVSMSHDNDSLFVAVTGPAWSWVAIGVSSDNATTMGFIVIFKSGSGYLAQEGQVTNVSENMPLVAVEPDHRAAIDDFEAKIFGSTVTAELQLSLSSSIWMLQAGIVYPSVVATNLTAPPGVPGAVSGDSVHFVGSYLLRPIDDVKNMNDLLNGKISPAPSLVAVAVISVGIIAIFTEFVVRRRI